MRRNAEEEEDEEFVVSGVVVEKETGRPLANLVVRAFDRDLIFDDTLGYTSTDDDGHFEIRFDADEFQEIWESRPDLYLKIYDKHGVQLIHETTNEIRWNASPDERYRVQIPARALDLERSHT